MSTKLTMEQASALQAEVQQELERREWAETGDSVMAEYVCVLLTNGSARDKVQTEMDDLVGADFDPSFLDWLFARHDALVAPEPASAPAAPAAAPQSAEAEPAPAPATAASPAGSRMFASAVEGTKRKAEGEHERRRLPDGPLGAPPSAPTGPRMGGQGRNLADRLGPRGNAPMRGNGLPIRGRGGHANQPFRQGPGFQQQQAFGMPGVPGQQEMMMQMMAMQANMMQMAEQMQTMQQEKPRGGRPTRGGAPNHSTHTKSTPAKNPASKGPIPDAPSSSALCKFGVGCSNARCTYSHPSPVADEKTGMVLSSEACPAGKACQDAECVKSHVSPAAVLGEAAGPARLLCKFQHCTNPACQFRHEDGAGNAVAPPALTNPPPASDGAKPTLDSALGDAHTPRPCRYAERCTRADCKFAHPASRPPPKGAKPAGRASAFAKTAGRPEDAIAGGMGPSKKFGLNPNAGEFKPKEDDIQVTM